MKQRFSSLDVKAVAHELQQSLVNLRLSNVYDLSSKILLLKFAKPDNKKQLLIDSGFRCHLTDFARAAAPAPSVFVARLRKFLKTRRVTSVSQIGTDRIIEFQFSDGQYRLYLEFFASGNVILTDRELKIITLLRNVPEGEGQEPQRVGLTYSLDNRQNFGGIPALTKERLRNALTTIVEKASAATQSDAKKPKRKAGGDLRRGLATTITELPPILVDHVFKGNNFDPKIKPSEILENEKLFDALFGAVQQARDIVDHVGDSDTTKGFIVAKRKEDQGVSPSTDQTNAEIRQFEEGVSKGLLYDDFSPFLPRQFADDPQNVILEFAGFNRTVDEFFSSVEGQKLESRLAEREENAKRKLEATRQDHARRIEGLFGSQLLNLRKASAIQANVERVQEAMDAVIGLLEQGMDWLDVGKLIEREQKRRNPVAEIIKLPLNLANNTITLLLGEEEQEDDGEGPDQNDATAYDTDSSVSDDEGGEEEEGNTAGAPKKERLEVDINLNLSPWANAGEYYDQKRSAAVKQEKTLQVSSVALKSAERKIARDLKEGLKQEKPVIQPIRRQLWFEKFFWFVSSDGYLVLGGRDAQQNEMLYRRHLRKGDVYVHADLHGAPSVVIKNDPRTPDAPVPPSTLTQAGQLAVCASGAWDSKAGMGAWWVAADQVSKAAPTGEYLPAGSFMVRGQKNFLQPAQLVIGFGVVFRVSEESRAKHVKHRLYDGLDDDAASRVDTRAVPPEAESDDEPAEAREAAASVESEAEENDDNEEDASARANPLQSHEERPTEAHGEDVRQPTQGVAVLQVSDQAAAPHKITPTEEEEENEEGGLGPEDDDLEDKAVAEEALMETPAGASTPATSIASTPISQRRGPQKRGQRGKAKKIAAKYRDQDDEDRAAAEALLGAAAGRLKREAEAKAKEEREAALEATRERRREQHLRQQRDAAEHEEVRRLMLEEGVEVLDEAESAALSPLDSLVGTPLPGDEILEVIPVCAPYTALNKVKYKAKLQPGAQKKGKAVKEILEGWKAAAAKKGVVDEASRDGERMWPREVELIKGIKPEEAINCVPVGKVKLMMSGGIAGGGGGGGSGASKGGQGKGGAKGGKGSKKK